MADRRGGELKILSFAVRLVKRELDIVFRVLDCHLRFMRALWNRRNDFTATRLTGFSRVKVRHAVTASDTKMRRYRPREALMQFLQAQ